MGLGLGFTAGLLLGGSIGMSFFNGFVQGATCGMMIAGALAVLAGLGGFFMLIFTDAKKRAQSAKFATAVLLAGLVYGGIGAGVYSTSDFQTGPSGPQDRGGPANGPGAKGKH
jgi:hypothetical protein